MLEYWYIERGLLEMSLGGSYSNEASKCRFTFDVESLFTNLPLEVYTELAVDYISDGNTDLNGSFYDQIDGVAMGFPIASVLANLFMGHHEKLWLENFHGSTMNDLPVIGYPCYV